MKPGLLDWSTAPGSGSSRTWGRAPGTLPFRPSGGVVEMLRELPGSPSGQLKAAT